jgi:hypothetical protein
MDQINKLDYFVGVFLAKILGDAKNVPALFNGTDESKQIQFETNSNKFNVFVKYSTKRTNSPASKNGKRKPKIYWNINFTQNELDRFKQTYKENWMNCLAIVCTNSTLESTWIAAIEYKKVLHCLQTPAPSGIYRICVSRFGNAREFILTGVGFKKDEYENCDFDYSLFFKK